MSLHSLTPLAALPIREQPSGTPPGGGVSSVEVALLAGLFAGVLVAVAVLWIGRRHRRSRRLGNDERLIWAAMDELCRGGWTAQLTLYGESTPLPGDAPEIEGLRVRVDWAELTGAEGDYDRDVAVARRFWSRSLAAALRTMVEDRRIDFQLEEIERAHPPER